jgi:hypothetical protein
MWAVLGIVVMVAGLFVVGMMNARREQRAIDAMRAEVDINKHVAVADEVRREVDRLSDAELHDRLHKRWERPGVLPGDAGSDTGQSNRSDGPPH